MSEWAHAFCGECWFRRLESYEKIPTRVRDGDDICCACGNRTGAGIYIRQDPRLTQCSGAHPEPSQKL